MAHKVLSKDMFELVSAMKLAQEYSETTLDVEYRKYVSNCQLNLQKITINNFFFRSMLSAAHVLAMDAKNLLDVVDSIRMRFPAIDAKQNTVKIPSPQHQSNSEPDVSSPNLSSTVEENYQNINPLQKLLLHSSPPTSLSQSYGEQQLYSNQQQMGIYDNECVINQHNKNIEKPAIATKPPNLSLKMKARLNNPFEDSLKIIEDDVYSNTSGTSGQKLPEPVSCTIVQENLITNQKVMSSSRLE